MPSGSANDGNTLTASAASIAEALIAGKSAFSNVLPDDVLNHSKKPGRVINANETK